MTPTENVCNKLVSLGFDVWPEDIRVCRGPKQKQDIIQCWYALCKNEAGEDVELASYNTLSKLQRGLYVRPSTDRDEIYGTHIVEPTGHESSR